MFWKLCLFTNIILLLIVIEAKFVNSKTLYRRNISKTKFIRYIEENKNGKYQPVSAIDKITPKSEIRGDTTAANLKSTSKLKETIININKRLHAKELAKGDILLPTLRYVGSHRRKWSKTHYGVYRGLVLIPYIFEKDFTLYYQEIIKNALSWFTKHTCVRYIPKTRPGPHIKFHNGESCSSGVGMTNSYRGQTVNLHIPECLSVGTVLHELMHTIGFWHEQTRSDRDKYVRINYEHIDKEHHNVFDKMKLPNLVVYDYGSVLHYDSLPFASKMFYKSIEVLSDRKPKPDIGHNNQRLSPYDIEEIKYLYNCEHGTYQRCGKDFTNQGAGTFKSPNYPLAYPKKSHCTWKITVGRGQFVKVTFQNISIPDSPYCQNDVILVHDGNNAGAPVLRRICGNKSEIEVTTSGRSIFVIFSSDTNQDYSTGFRAIFTETAIQGITPQQLTSPLAKLLLPINKTIDKLQCSFDDGMCGMYEDKAEEMKWIRKRGPDYWYRYTGPAADNTSGKGHYLMVESSMGGRTRGDVGIIRTPWFQRHQTFNIKFSYHMFGRTMGALGLYAYELTSDKSTREVLLFLKECNQGNIWHTKQITFNPQRDTQFLHFYWKSHRDGWRSNLALDDISIRTGEDNQITKYRYSCKNPNYVYIDESRRKRRFSTGCLNNNIFWIQCCNFTKIKTTYRHVKGCSAHMFTAEKLNWYCNNL